MEMTPKLLHGTLDVTIFEVEGLPKSFISKQSLYVIVDLEELDKGKIKSSDLRTTTGRTRTIVLERSTSNLSWNDSMHLYCAHTITRIVFAIKSHNLTSKLIGKAFVPTSKLVDGVKLDDCFDVLGEDGMSIHSGCKLHVKLLYSDVKTSISWDRGLEQGHEFAGVPFTYYSQREGCKVTLYQDAHVSDNFDPNIVLHKGIRYTQHRCWEDIFNAINNAKYMIYIAGWSVYTPITLIRDEKGGNRDITLGELLKKKANEGVRVLILVWKNEIRIPLYAPGGLFVQTHDVETKEFFKGTNVKCVRCSREPDRSVALFFTHHQKTVVVDSPVTENLLSEKRRIVSFIGGIDLCDGRYDTQSHSLFRTLNGPHQHDFYQNSYKNASIKFGGPREPWHDIHCKLEGPIAWDVLENFEERWKKQEKEPELLLNVSDSPFIPPSPVIFPDNDSESNWNVQLFRSIDGGAVASFPKDPEGAFKMGLFNGKKYLIERSIQDAYINAIRRAKRFIYIENQYFIGSSFDWTDLENKDDATNLIPKELCLKIVSKIEKEERFSVYIVIPMWPEGIPDKDAIQAILDFQRKTIEMMFTTVANALQTKGSKAHPKDYLSFFCLGNREKKMSGEYTPPNNPSPNTDYWRAQQARRSMIYVHSKMMIVDDEYIIVGSANINQRSMDGARDTEIAMGAFQPLHIAKDGQPANGQVHWFRMSLWYEHLSLLDETFYKPESLECIQKVNELAKGNWDHYRRDNPEPDDLPGHLLTYPYQVGGNGKLNSAERINFPDTNASIWGAGSWYIPDEIPTL